MNNYKFVSFALLFVAISLQGCDHYEGNLRTPATDYKVFWDLDDKYVTDGNFNFPRNDLSHSVSGVLTE